MPELILPANAYNNSIIRYQNRMLMSYRWHNHNGDWKTSLGMVELDEQFRPITNKPIVPPSELKDNAHEDGRLWLHNGKLWIAWTVAQWTGSDFKAIMAYGRLVEDKDCWTITSHCIPAYGQNTFEAIEKNWAFVSHNGKLYALYLTHEQQIWLELDEQGRVEEVHKSKALRWPHAAVHGGAICEGQNGNLVHFFNSHTTHRDRALDRYLVGVAELAGQPPFEMLRISSRPILIGTEGVCLDKNPRYKQNVVFVCGALKTGEQEWTVSFGRNDSQSCLVKLGLNDLKL